MLVINKGKGNSLENNKKGAVRPITKIFETFSGSFVVSLDGINTDSSIGKVKLEEKAWLVQRNRGMVNKKITLGKALRTSETQEAIGCGCI